MTEVILLQRPTGRYGREPVFFDKALQDGAITIDQNAYTTGLDRLYDVRGKKNIHVVIKNTGGANGLTFTIEGADEKYDSISSLVDADFDNVIKADTNVAFGTSAPPDDIIDISPESTAIRIRVKRQTTALDTTLAGVVSVN